MLKLLLSPAKKIAPNADQFVRGHTLSAPLFMERTRALVQRMQGYQTADLMRLMHISQALAELNEARYNQWDGSDIPTSATAAIATFQGDAYRALDITTLADSALAYLSERLYILSGLYGIIRPYDAILPYRLEMGTRLAVDGAEDLYAFWSDTLATYFQQEQPDYYINLASGEYAKAALPHLHSPVVSIVFKDWGKSAQKYQTIGVQAKRARGLMVRYMAEHNINSLDTLKQFSTAGYSYAESESNEQHMVFYGAR